MISKRSAIYSFQRNLRAGASARHGRVDDKHDLVMEKLERIDEKLYLIEEKIEELSDQFTRKIARSEYESETLKRQSDEIQEYRSDLYKKITLPILKEIIDLREQLGSSLARAYSSGEENPQVPARLIETYQEIVEVILETFGIECLETHTGEKLVSGFQRPVGRVRTGNKDEHGCIAEALGGTYLMDGKCVVPAQVKVYTYDEALDSGGREALNDGEEPDADAGGMLQASEEP